MSFYVSRDPVTENGSHGNPQSNCRDGMVELPDELLSDYIATMGFADLTVKNNVVTKVKVNQAAYDAYQAEHQPVEPTPAEKREQAYETEKLIEWDAEMLTVDEAGALWAHYAAEGSEKADELQALIAAAKATIREMYPDEA